MNKTVFYIFALLWITTLYASEALLEQATLLTNEFMTRHQIKGRYTESTSLDGLAFLTDVETKRLVAFHLTNNLSSKINPHGSKNNSYREYHFKFPYTNVQETYLFITDVPFDGPMSHTMMHTEMHFFPAIVKPTVKIGKDQLIVTLPTGEIVKMSKKDKEIIEGPLKELPIDYNKDRFLREMPRVTYDGQGLVMTLKRRGEDPRWSKTNAEQFAIITLPSSSTMKCKISTKDLFDHTPRKGEDAGTLLFKFRSNELFYQFIEKRCGFNLNNVRAFENKQREAMPIKDCSSCP